MKTFRLFRSLLVIVLALLLCFTAACTPAPDTAASTSTDTVSDPWGLNPIQPKDYYGRNQLSGKELKAYNKIAEGVISTVETVDLSDCKLSVDRFKKVLNYYRADYPQHFWLEADYVLQATKGVVLSYQPKYSMHPLFVEMAKDTFEETIDSLLPILAEFETDYEKEKYIHDYLSDNTEYSSDGNHAYTAYGALVQKKAVCEGYSKAFQYLCYRAGIQCLLVTGTSVNPMVKNSDPIAHSWNKVKLDGKYYNVDLTWDDQSAHVFYSYFNTTDKMIKEDHTFSENNYPLPKSNSKDKWYFSLEDCIFEEYSVESIADWLKQNDNYARVYIPDDPEAFLAWYKRNIESIASKLGAGKWYVYSYGQLGNEFVLALGDGTVN